MYYAVVCAIAKNEDDFVEEWVKYHLSIGFEHIYIYDNNSAVPVSKILSNYIDANLVSVIDFPRADDQQRAAYVDALQKYGEQCRWMAFIDIDEFIVPKKTNDIRDLLDGYCDYGGLAIHWKVMGSCGHKKRPVGGVIKNYTSVVCYDNHIKSIVQPSKVTKVFTPHSFGYKNGCFCVNEDAVPVVAHQSYHVSRTVWINHYYYKSFEDFNEKLKRGCATGTDRNFKNEIADFEQQETHGGELEPQIQAVVAQKSSLRTLDDLCQYVADCKKSSEAYEKMIVDCLSLNKIDLTLQMLRTYLRYYDAELTLLFAAQIYLRAGKPEACLAYMQRLLVNEESPLRATTYACLAEYYRHVGDMLAADRLRNALL